MTNPLHIQPNTPRRILFAGGAGTIGAALVAASVERGDRVIILDLPVSLAARPQLGLEAAIAVDATDPAQLEQAFARVASLWEGIEGIVILPGLLRRKQPVGLMA